MSIEPAVSIFDSHVSFIESAEAQSAEVDVPDSVIDFFQSNAFAHEGDGDVDPATIPADAAIGADVADLVAVRNTQAGQRPGERVLVIAGSGHAAVMHDLLRADSARGRGRIALFPGYGRVARPAPRSTGLSLSAAQAPS